ncbi:hypothetical protein SZN_09351 [Streptomyces zinciresistens K42]|uniref:Uncharacterized protein n=1 Tax=Streptomyces zinciresistens K42 TaxID=700597 RepID=G2G8Q2_9ACTN|nr:hypothetical protein [Streptomyces zinciresistens]EGX60117.1 hypothetical protein SZN_09351 [Streptomyces zinciresistens K42]
MNTPNSRGQAHINAQVRDMLQQLADRLQTRRPDETLTATARIAAIQATTMDPPLARTLREHCPEVTGPITRSAYAALLRQAADRLSTSRPASQAERVAALHEQCDRDYADGRAHRDLNGNRDDAHLIADATHG